MSSINMFFITFVEVLSLIILWNNLGLKADYKYLKIFIITVTTSIVVIITNRIDNPYVGFANFLLFNMMVKVIFKKGIKELLIEFSVAAIICILLELLIIVLVNDLGSSLNENSVIAKDVIVNVLLLITSTILSRFLPIKKIYYKYREELSNMILIAINLIFFVLISKIIWDYNRSILLNHFMIFVLLFIVFIFLNVTFTINGIKLRLKTKEIETYNRYIPIANNIIEEIKRKQHDFKNQLNTIYGIAQVTDEKELKSELMSYIESLNNSFLDMDSLIDVTNKVIIGTIYSKLCEAKTRGINFCYEIEDRNIDYPIKDYELSQVLCNLIDNSFEAVERNVDFNKNVYLKLGYESNRAYLEIRNEGAPIDPSIINKIFKKGFSSKADSWHGYGLYNVKQVVESYNGKIQLSYENIYVVFKIVF